MNTQHKKQLLLEAIKEMIADGVSVEIPVHGLSMFPCYLPGDVVKVIPIDFNNLKKGDVVFFERQKRIVFHRLIKFDHTKGQYLTKGDGLINFDKIINRDKLLAISILHKRNGKVLKIRHSIFIKQLIVITTPILGYFTYYLARIWYKLKNSPY
ncbi:hypothetical protein [Saccharicrinis aurantiacus]|uniref:hypothetical protein n=1 Tax=Saccharicrinis aurantiacus TaxID=1849719 RepID=UPI00249214FB|nr:hypothetical protein [Saccharicrinis aurantiacus]